MQTATMERSEPRDFRALAAEIRATGLLDRRLGYYGVKLVATVLAFGVGWAAFFVLGRSWATLGIATYLGFMSTQLGFLGHDAGHGQIFRSRRANRLLGMAIGNGLIGLSYGWWVTKHNAHHAYPNQIDRDPDIGIGLPGLHAVGAEPGPVAQRLVRWQAALFFPLMLLRSTGLYVSGVHGLLRRRDRAAIPESLLIVAHASLYLTAVFWLLPPLEAVVFIMVHQAVFSIYLGCSFAPNHKGMPLIDRDAEMGFARRQITTSRNLSGGRLTTFVLGGLNHQIEHHLFPTMPRPNLVRARETVRAFCLETELDYCEEGLIASFRQSINALRRPTSILGAGAVAAAS